MTILRERFRNWKSDCARAGFKIQIRRKRREKVAPSIGSLPLYEKTGGQTIVRSGYYATLGDYATRVDPFRIVGKV